jgi:hypothetical protein
MDHKEQLHHARTMDVSTGQNIRLITLTAPGFWMNHFDP